MIEVTENEGIVTLRLAHGKASALDLELVEAFARAIAEVGASDARAVIVTGTGSIFSAGVDLFRVVDGGAEYIDRFVPALSRMLLDLFAVEKPVVAAINGHAIAGGCVLALACDYRLMVAGKGRIGMPELLVGVAFPPSVLEVLRFALPPPTLQSVVYTGGTVEAHEAHRIGMIDEVTDAEALASRALELARKFASLPPRVFALAKRELRDIANDRARSFSSKYDHEVLAVWKSEETLARVRAYLASTVRK